jgi:hypothetical protein
MHLGGERPVRRALVEEKRAVAGKHRAPLRPARRHRRQHHVLSALEVVAVGRVLHPRARRRRARNGLVARIAIDLFERHGRVAVLVRRAPQAGQQVVREERGPDRIGLLRVLALGRRREDRDPLGRRIGQRRKRRRLLGVKTLHARRAPRAARVDDQ